MIYPTGGAGRRGSARRAVSRARCIWMVALPPTAARRLPRCSSVFFLAVASAVALTGALRVWAPVDRPRSRWRPRSCSRLWPVLFDGIGADAANRGVDANRHRADRRPRPAARRCAGDGTTSLVSGYLAAFAALIRLVDAARLLTAGARSLSCRSPGGRASMPVVAFPCNRLAVAGGRGPGGDVRARVGPPLASVCRAAREARPTGRWSLLEKLPRRPSRPAMGPLSARVAGRGALVLGCVL